MRLRQCSKKVLYVVANFVRYYICVREVSVRANLPAHVHKE